MERPFIAVYIVTNKPYGTLYAGVTSDLYRRVRQHRDGTFDGFTKEHGLSQLVWFEPFEMMIAAIKREKAIKRYLRDWKINLIERDNPHWADLSLEWDRPAVWMHGPAKE
ncbi:putative endonuclease [Brevundimonas nasdae]|uniref:GIY-YIG nuclease family protein n=1 Tax=Brevundimonas nasdae TaxID=172043 RepID=UPI001913AF82|nr:GIY-YIG nuclease family protein [Brevundimonas nasdae]MBK6024451.1 GIY-YIG nuclease family protein [Brevundimonas nasdae]MDQ0451109.1 putative endonuclease [Brevundimonas nasdae]